jgi:hypothetical protein
MATLDEVTAVVGQLSIIYSKKELDPALPEAWAPLFEDVPAEDLFRAAAEHARESRFWPAPSELRARAIRLDDDMASAEEAWLEVKQAISKWGLYGRPTFSHEAVMEAVVAMGWEDLCSMDIGDQAAERAHFFRIYGSFRATRIQEAQIGSISPSVAGLIEGIGDMPQ